MAAIIDLYSRMVVGWSMSNSINKQLVIDALLMAVDRRKPVKNLLFHSDQGWLCCMAQVKKTGSY
uniref:DDE-type integrase/transposase/recombinase n=1 Tax=Wolbachia endosymbiont (group B) of Athalia cordata TaxID=2953986 RepID=UPI00222F4442|nr:DDE-type integrase/transposase/recombinase [Wolbachia endosymbiont (group B) of Athalia cordata]